MGKITIWHLSKIFTLLICIACFCCPTLSSSEQIIETDNTYPAPKYRSLVERHVKDLKILADKYRVTRDEVKKGQNFISEEKQGSTYIVKIFDKKLKKEVTLFYDDWSPNAIRQAVAFGKGTGFSVGYFKNGDISHYYEVKDNKVDGVDIGFYDNGKLRWFRELKDNYLLGIRLEWRANGEQRKFIEYKEPYAGTNEETDSLEEILDVGEITIQNRSLIIDNTNYNLKSYQYKYPILITYTNKSQAKYHTPEHATVSLLSAVESLDYNWWLQGWANKSEEQIESLPFEFRNWFKVGKLYRAHHALYQRVEYICNGQLYVLMGYTLTTGGFGKNATNVLALKKTESGWRATMDLKNDPVYINIGKLWSSTDTTIKIDI